MPKSARINTMRPVRTSKPPVDKTGVNWQSLSPKADIFTTAALCKETGGMPVNYYTSKVNLAQLVQGSTIKSIS